MSIVTFDGNTRQLHGDIRLNGTEIDMIVGGALASFDEELAVDGSPIIRVGILDPECELERSGLIDLLRDDAEKLRREVELVVDNVAYWIRHVARPIDSDVITLTFEDREVCRMRDTTGRMKVSARAMNVRGFIRRLCSLAGTPALITNDPTDRETDARRRGRLGTTLQLEEDRADRDKRRKPGIAENARLTVKGSPASAEQIRLGSIVLSTCRSDGAGPKATLAAMEAAIIENALSNSNEINDPGSTSVGVFQAQFGLSEGIGDRIITREEALDVEYMTRCFLEDSRTGGFASKGGARYLERTRPTITAHEIAILVEAPAAQYEHRYQTVETEARHWIELFFGGNLPLSSGLSGTITTIKESPLVVEAGESYWDAAVRVADSYNARFFVVANQPYFLFDDALMRSRPVLTIANPRHPDADPRRTRGVRGIGWEWAPRKQLRQADLALNVRVRHVPPGSVVLLDETCGPAGSDDANPNRGRWLVGRYSRSRFDAEAQLTLIKGRRPRIPTVTDEESFTIDAADRARGSVRVGKGGTTSPFGGSRKYPISGAYGTNRGDHIHAGLDVGVPGGTPCIAPFDGKITMATTAGFGDVGGMIHLQAIAAVPGTSIKAGDKIGWGHASDTDVKVGQRVAAGDRVGTSGWHHVHFVLLRAAGGGNGVDGNADPTTDLRALGGLS